MLSYDPAGPLTSATGAYGALAYSYDANGNRLSASGPTGVEAYSCQHSTNSLTQAGARTFTMDATGFRTADDKYTYSYPPEGGLPRWPRITYYIFRKFRI